MAGSDFEFVLFDLGGVLVRLGGVVAMQQLAGVDSEEQVWARWLSCPWVRRFERGRCSAEDFGRGVVADWGLGVSPEAFLDEFRRWPEGLFDGAEELVDAVRARVSVGCLSNSNALHWASGAPAWGLAEMFELTFLSHEMGLIKPDREVFDYVASALGGKRERVLFLDDNAINVIAAKSAGFAALQVRGAREARSALVEVGVLSPNSDD